MCGFKSNRFILLIIAAGVPVFCQSQVVLQAQRKHKVMVIAHRGDHSKAPENTLAAYQAAIDDGADFIEIDLRQTRDSQLVIMHNENINKMTGFDMDVTDLLFDSLRLKKVRDAFYTEYGLHKIPILKEVLELCKGKINIYLNFLEADVAETFKEIFDAGMQDHVVVYINETHQYNEWKTIAPMMPLIISLPEKINTALAMQDIFNILTVDILNGDPSNFSAEKIAWAKEKHIPVWADVQADKEDAGIWNGALLMGFTGLKTNYPKQLINFLKEKGLR